MLIRYFTHKHASSCIVTDRPTAKAYMPSLLPKPSWAFRTEQRLQQLLPQRSAETQSKNIKELQRISVTRFREKTWTCAFFWFEAAYLHQGETSFGECRLVALVALVVLISSSFSLLLSSSTFPSLFAPAFVLHFGPRKGLKAWNWGRDHSNFCHDSGYSKTETPGIIPPLITYTHLSITSFRQPKLPELPKLPWGNTKTPHLRSLMLVDRAIAREDTANGFEVIVLNRHVLVNWMLSCKALQLCHPNWYGMSLIFA